MAEYIMREPAILAVNMAMDKFPYAKDPKSPETYSKYNEGWTDACDYILGMIEAENFADVSPVLHGYWILKHIGAWHTWECSLCHKQPCVYITKDTNYCPHCGAKMDLNEE